MLDLSTDLELIGWDVLVLAPHAHGAARRERLGTVDVERFRYMAPTRAQTLCYQGGALVNLRESRSAMAQTPLLVAAETAATLRAVRRFKPDVIHAHWLVPQGFVAAKVGQMTKTPVVTTVHGGDVFGLSAGPIEPFKRAAIVGSSAVTANSSATVAAVKRLAPGVEHVVRIPMGVTTKIADDEAADAVRVRYADDGPLVVFAGRMVPEKGVYDIVDAAAIARDRVPGVRFVMLGAGQHLEDVERRAVEAGVDDIVALPGWVDPADVAVHLRAADVILAPSKRASDGWVEAQGLSIVEAMAQERTIVTTSAGGIGDAVRHDDTGWVVPEGDPPAIADAIETLWADEARRQRIGAAGRRLVLDVYDRDKVAARFDEVLDRAVLTRSPKAPTNPPSASGADS